MKFEHIENLNEDDINAIFQDIYEIEMNYKISDYCCMNVWWDSMGKGSAYCTSSSCLGYCAYGWTWSNGYAFQLYQRGGGHAAFIEGWCYR